MPSPPSAPLDAYERAPRRWRTGVGAIALVILLALAVTVGVTVVRSAGDPGEVLPLSTPEPAEQATEASVYVHVSGAVRAPGLYRLPADSRVFDAVAAASGFTEEADRGAVNLARVLADGEQVVVPTPGAAAEGGAAVPGDGRVSLNSGTLADLDTLPRVGPAIAQRIIEWREANGPFTSVDDLLSVPGIGEKMLEAIRPMVVL